MKKRIQIFLLVAIITCSFAELISKLLFGFPIVHLGNGIVFAIFAYSFFNGKLKEVFDRGGVYATLCKVPLVFLIIGSIGTIVFGASVVQYLWSIRNYARLICLFFDVIMYFDRESLFNLYKLLNVVMVVHVAITLIQFFVYGIRWDYLNGIFGSSMGGDGAVNVLFVVNTVASLYLFYKKRIRWQFLVLNLLVMGINSAMNELKFYYVELVVAMIIYCIITKDVKRVLRLSVVFCIIIVFSLRLMYNMYPYFEGFFGKGMLLNIISKLAEPYRDNSESLSRSTQISGMVKPILDYAESKLALPKGFEKLWLLIGLGIGNGEWGTSGAFRSEFYSLNHKLGYDDFMESIIFVETGILGLLVSNGMLLYLLIKNTACALIENYKKGKEKIASKTIDAAIFAAMIFALTLGIMIYDNSLRTNNGYILWCAMAVPFIIEY